MTPASKVRRLFPGDRILWGFVILSTVVGLAGVGYSSARAATERKAARQEAARETPTVVTPSIHPRATRGSNPSHRLVLGAVAAIPPEHAGRDRKELEKRLRLREDGRCLKGVQKLHLLGGASGS